MEDEKVFIDDQPFVTLTNDPALTIKEHQKKFYKNDNGSENIWEQAGEPIITEVGEIKGLKEYLVAIPERRYKVYKKRSR